MDEKASYAIVVVTYYPDRRILQNIKDLSDACGCVIIIDNTPGDIAIPFPFARGITLERLGSNKGLAFALNRGMRIARKHQMENVFLLDQDSRPGKTYFRQMLEFKTIKDAENAKIAFVVPDFFDRNSKTFAKFPLVRRFYFKHVSCKQGGCEKIKGALIAITSGMLISYSRYREIGPFPEDYFIDFIDNAYCLAVARKKLAVAVNCDVLLNHSVGSRSVHRFFGLIFKPNNHPPVRRYYIARNGLRTAATFRFEFPSYLWLIGLRLVHEFFSILLFEGDKTGKIRALFIGCWDGLRGRMGECNQNF